MTATEKMGMEELVNALLQESSKTFEESAGLKWEWDHYAKIYRLIEAIRTEETLKEANRNIKTSNLSDNNNKEIASSSEEQRRSQAFPEFMKWLEANGVDCHKFEIKFSGDSGFGIHLRENVREGDAVFEVPEKIILSSLKVFNSKLGQIIEKDPILRSMQNVALAMYLIYQKFGNNDLQWKPYIDTLPSFYDTVVYFSQEDMAVMKHAPSAFRDALKMVRNVARQYSYFHLKFEKAADPVTRAMRKIFTLDRYIWAVSSVTTRLNHLPNPEGEEIMCLIPLWDMCNHDQSLGAISTDYKNEEKKLVCFAARDFAVKSEFNIFYGNRSSIDYLVHNGFVPEGYKSDIYYLELSIGLNDPNHTRKKALLGHLGLTCHKTFLVKPERITTCRGLFAFVKIFLANKDVLEAIESTLDTDEHLNDPDEKSLKYLLTRFTLLRRAVETTKTKLQNTIESTEHEKPRSQTVLQLLKNEAIALDQLIASTNQLISRLT